MLFEYVNIPLKNPYNSKIKPFETVIDLIEDDTVLRALDGEKISDGLLQAIIDRHKKDAEHARLSLAVWQKVPMSRYFAVSAACNAILGNKKKALSEAKKAATIFLGTWY